MSNSPGKYEAVAITQEFSFSSPVQALVFLKRCQGPQDGDVLLAYPMIAGYEATLDDEAGELTLKFKLSREEPPPDWLSMLDFQNEGGEI